MKTNALIAATLAAATLACAMPAQAVAVAGSQGAAAQGRSMVPAVAAPATTSVTVELAQGVIAAVSADKSSLTLAGRSVALHPQLRVFDVAGQALGGAAALRGGMAIRFALEPAAPTAAERRIVLIYLSAR